MTQLALPGRVDVSALAVGPPSAAGFAFSVSVAAADGYWGEADVSVADVSLNQDGVVTVSTSGSVFFPRVSVVAAPAAVGEPDTPTPSDPGWIATGRPTSCAAS